jgi:hypothetical protein
MKTFLNAHITITVVSILLSLMMRAQITTFQKIYPAIQNQSGIDVLPTPDGGYLIAGTTEDSIPNDVDIKIVKTNSHGDTLWTKRYGGSRPEYPTNMLATNDGNYFIVGGSQSFGSGDLDVYLLKIDPYGNMIWTKTYGGSGNEDGNEIVASADGNYVIVGGSNSANLSHNAAQLTKVDPAGNLIWMKYYGGSGIESARSVKLCSDGGFIIAGNSASTYTSLTQVFVVKTTATGDTLWTQKYGGPDSYDGKSILVNNDGTYTLALDDSSGSRDSDVRIMKLSSTGTILWNHAYGGIKKDISKTIQHTTDGGYIVACISRSFGWINPDFWLLKLNAMGDTTWTRHYGGSGHEHCYGARQTSDGGYVAIGHSKSYSPNTEIMFVKLDTAGNINITSEIKKFLASNLLNVYPNPSADGVVSIDFGEEIAASILKISNGMGQEVCTKKIEANSNKNILIDLADKPKGIYWVQIISENRKESKKIIIE